MVEAISILVKINWNIYFYWIFGNTISGVKEKNTLRSAFSPYYEAQL